MKFCRCHLSESLFDGVISVEWQGQKGEMTWSKRLDDSIKVPFWPKILWRILCEKAALIIAENVCIYNVLIISKIQSDSIFREIQRKVGLRGKESILKARFLSVYITKFFLLCNIRMLHLV